MPLLDEPLDLVNWNGRLRVFGAPEAEDAEDAIEPIEGVAHDRDISRYRTAAAQARWAATSGIVRLSPSHFDIVCSSPVRYSTCTQTRENGFPVAPSLCAISKSLGNTFTIPDVVAKGFRASAVR